MPFFTQWDLALQLFETFLELCGVQIDGAQLLWRDGLEPLAILADIGR